MDTTKEVGIGHHLPNDNVVVAVAVDVSTKDADKAAVGASQSQPQSWSQSSHIDAEGQWYPPYHPTLFILQGRIS